MAIAAKARPVRAEPGRPRLRGIGAAILAFACVAACDAESPAAVDAAAVAASAPALPDAPVGLAKGDRAAIMRAAGFTRPHGDNRWRYAEADCGSVWAEIEQITDINGDGGPDVIVQSDDDRCLGMNQRRVTLLTRTAAGWEVVADFQRRFAVFSFHPRPGIAWPDIEIFDGMTGVPKPDGSIDAGRCEPFLRWDGRRYVDGGTSQDGRICELTAEGRVAAGTTAAARGRLAFPAIEKGYYAIGTSCTQAIADGGDLLAYLDEQRFASFDGALAVDGFEALGGDRYRVRGADMVIAVEGRTRFTDVEFGTRYTHCPTTQVPRPIRAEWGDLSGR